jgi:ABC-type multidrug transport system fused ATPase/permease subunit
MLNQFFLLPKIDWHTGEGKAVSRVPLIPGAGRIINKDNIIHFEHVPLVTPNGDVLIEDMSFEVHSGMNVLVCGPNGCGKSSLFRVLGEVRKINDAFLFQMLINNKPPLVYLLSCYYF